MLEPLGNAPLDLLLERTGRVDLAQIAVVTPAEQIDEVVATAIAQRRVPLLRPAAWLIMAAWLTLPRSRLLLLAAAAESAEAAHEVAGCGGGWRTGNGPAGWQTGGAVAAARAAGGCTRGAGAEHTRHRRRRRPVAGEHGGVARDPLGPLMLPQRDGCTDHGRRRCGGWRMTDETRLTWSLLPLASEARARPHGQRPVALATTVMAGLELGWEGIVILDQAEACDLV